MNITYRSQEDIKRRINQYKKDCEPYINMLCDIQAHKATIRMVINKKTGDIAFDYGEDSPTEIKIKQEIEYLKEYYFGNQN